MAPNLPYGCGHFWDNYPMSRNGDVERNRRANVKTIRILVTKSTTRPGMLSFRLRRGDATATPFLQALTDSGARPGDVLEVSLADKPAGHLDICECPGCSP